MSESEEENQDFPPKAEEPTEEQGYGMDFDLDLENSWPLDHMSFISNPMSPFMFSEQPSSPLWAFTDGEDERHAARLAASAFSDCHKIVSSMFFLLLSDWFSVDFCFETLIHLLDLFNSTHLTIT